MQDNLIVALQQRGMSEKEAKIYLTVLELWSAPASTIARRAEMKRVTWYVILKDFIRQRIATSTQKKGVTYFQVVNPEQLLHEIKDKYDVFKKYIPEFLAIQSTYDSKMHVEFHEWIEWLKYVYHDMAISWWDILAILSADEVHPKMIEYFLDIHIPERIQHESFAKVLVHDDKVNKHYQKNDKERFRESRVIDGSILNFANEIDLYWWNKVAFCMRWNEEVYGVIVNSKKLYETLESIFNFMWAQAS